MTQYKMRIKIEMFPCDDVPTPQPSKEEDGSVSIVLSEADAVNIDVCERTLLQTAYPTLRDARSTHFSAVSKKNACEHQTGGGTLVKNTWPDRVDGELGRYEFPTYRVCQEHTLLYDTARALFPALGCWERHETVGLKEIALIRGVTEPSYRKTATLLNRIRHQKDATGSTTLRVSAEREGKQVMDGLERTTTAILHQEGFHATGQPVTLSPQWTHEAVVMPADRVKQALEACD